LQLLLQSDFKLNANMDYEKVPKETDSLNEEEDDEVPRIIRRRNPWTKTSIVGLGLLVIIQAIALISLVSKPTLKDPLLDLWSPANQVIKYKNIRHDAEDRSPYVAAERPIIDELWMDLYDFGTVGLTPSEVTRLIEPTKPSPMDPDTYPVMIQVFHNIHCLNLLRKAIWRDYYPEALDMLTDGTANRTSPKALHIDHCINAIREALMCSSDVTPITFHYVSDEDHHVFPNLAATHTCRDFDAIKDWAKTRQIEEWKMDIHLINETTIN